MDKGVAHIYYAKGLGKAAFKFTVGVYAGLLACAVIDGSIKGVIKGLASLGNETCQKACNKCGFEYEKKTD